MADLATGFRADRTGAAAGAMGSRPFDPATPPGPDLTPARIVAEEVLSRAEQRDVAARERDEQAHRLLTDLETDPHAQSALEVARRAAADRAAASADREAAARDRDVLARLAGCERPKGPRRRLPALTRRESQVLERLAKAMTTRAIAEDLFLSPNSVKTHTQSVYRKIGVRNRAEAALWARDHGIG